MTLPDVRELLPQQGRAVLLDRVVEWTPGSVSCAVHVRDDFPYMVEGEVPALVAIELMAQAVAAFVGLLRRQEGGSPRIGYLVSVRGLSSKIESFRAGTDLVVTARLVFRDSNAGSFACDVARDLEGEGEGEPGGRILSEATLTVYEAPVGEAR